ncbi:hypothetical protein CISIN_1g0409192mg, partial [Citrus sinensis]
MYLNLL